MPFDFNVSKYDQRGAGTAEGARKKIVYSLRKEENLKVKIVFQEILSQI